MNHAGHPASRLPATTGPFRFGRFALEPAQRRLLADGKPVAVGARAFDLLVALVGRAGTLLSKHELMEQVWPGLVVEENNLQVQVSSLRKVLGSGALSTIPGRGYRFELPVEAEAGSTAVADGVRAAGDAVAVPPAPATAESSGGRARSNLPAHLPLLFGRATDLAAIERLLAGHSVVTVAGAGGIGKTRVAQAVAVRLATERAAGFPDGVWWVDLAPLADGSLVPGAVARVLETVTSERPHLETIAAVLAPLRLLLVVDNCEHLLDAVAELIDRTCASAPGVRVLVTSQEPLKVADEHVYRLGALAVPGAEAQDEAMHAGAVELFAARAHAGDPRFELSPANVAAVAEICRRLDGIPLAIELAAARVPLLGVEGLRARLDERFSVLTAGARVVLRRHQTLRATLEWSHGLLTANEQRVFRRLGVFAGSFSLEAAQHVAQDPEIDGWAALDHLGALVDKSLVIAEGDPVPRYRLLETTRAYALERLGEAGETGATLRRHAEATLARLLAIDADYERRDHGYASHAETTSEIDNVRAALAWAADAEDAHALAIGLAAYSLRVWSGSHQLHEGMERGLSVARLARDDLPRTLVARFWLTVASLGMYAIRRDAYDAVTRAIAIYRTLDQPDRLFQALIHGAIIGYRFASADEVGGYIADAERLLDMHSPPSWRVRLEFARTRWFEREGRFEDELAAAQRQSAIAAASGSELGSLYAMSNVVGVLNRLGQHERALVHAEASIARLEALGGSAGAGHLWLGVMMAQLLLGQTDAAFAAGRTAYALLLREGDELRTLWGLALCALRSGAPEDAARILGHAEAAHQRSGVVPMPQTRGQEALWSELRASLDAGELQDLLAEGAAMRGDDVVRLALRKSS